MSQVPYTLDQLFDSGFIPEPNSGCWLWFGELNNRGYGRMRQSVEPYKRRWFLAHIFSYERFIGPVPHGLELDHKCRVRSCCNPNHVEPVTRRENMLRGNSPLACHARKTHCVHGHLFDEANTKRRVDSGNPNGSRSCRACAEAYNAARRAARLA